MKKSGVCLLMFVAVALLFAAHRQDALDKVSIYLNSKLVGTWRADEAEVVHINNISDNDTLIFSARSDVGGLGNSSIDIKDNSGIPVENIEDQASSKYAGNFTYVVNLKKIDTSKVNSIQVFLNVDPARNVPPPTIASITFAKK